MQILVTVGCIYAKSFAAVTVHVCHDVHSLTYWMYGPSSAGDMWLRQISLFETSLGLLLLVLFSMSKDKAPPPLLLRAPFMWKPLAYSSSIDTTSYYTLAINLISQDAAITPFTTYFDTTKHISFQRPYIPMQIPLYTSDLMPFIIGVSFTPLARQ